MMNQTREAPKVRKTKRLRPKAAIDPDLCSGCGICMAFCPVGCIYEVDGPLFPTVNAICRVDADRCTGCTICARECPWDAIEMMYPAEAEEAIKAAS